MSTTFSYGNIFKYTWTSAVRKTQNQIDLMLMVFEYIRSRYFRGAECDTDHYLVVPKLGKDWRK